VDPDLQHVYAIYGQHLVVLDATTATLAEIARYDLPHSIPPDDVVPSRPLVVNTRTHRVYWTQDGDDSSLGFFQDTDGRAPCVTSEAGCEATPAPAATATPTPPVSDVVGPTEIPTVPPATPMPLPSSDVAFATDTPVPASTPDPNCTPIATDGGDGDSSPTCGMVGGIVPAEDGQQASTPTTTASTPQATQEPAPDCSESAPRPIYRKGGTNPGNFRPRPQDEGRLSFWDSLTAVFEGQPVFQPGDDYVTVDASQLPPGSVEYDEDPPGHVSVIDVPPDELKALAQRCRVPSES
ncbi:MAG: hypothetical protein JOZ81_28210, partial [Chloroflexi bacterium]|nr:hypothetical protein [Chloroflexota bacterium]